MVTNSRIEWTDHTWNPWRGCTKKSEGCENCYMYRDAIRRGWPPEKVVRCTTTWNQPVKKNKSGDYEWKIGDMVFVCSWGDFFHKDADLMRNEAWDIIRRRPGLIWIFTTKRIERALFCLPDDWCEENYPNIILMPTCENPERANERIPELIEFRSQYPWVTAAVSVEPMLSQIDFTRIDFSAWQPPSFVNVLTGKFENKKAGFEKNAKLDWVIIGCEKLSGGFAGRFCKVEYHWHDVASWIIQDCLKAKVAVFVKQVPVRGFVSLIMSEWPNDLKIRQYPILRG